MANIFRIDRPTNTITLGNDNTTINPLGTFYKISTLAVGLNVLRVTGLQTDDTALTGTLRGAYIDVSNGSLAATGTIRALELKARTEAPGDTGNNVAVLEGLSISADSKVHDVTTMRAAEFILDGKTAGTIDEAVGLRIANNLQVDKATSSYGLQIYRDSFNYTADIQLSSGGLIGGSAGTLQITAAGKVGIGTDSPTEDVDLVGGNQTSFAIKSSGDGDSSELGFFNASNIFGSLGSFGPSYGLPVSNGIGLQSSLNNDGFIFFRTKTGGRYENRLWIINNGNVGIGVTDPHSKLEVNGAISSATLTFSTEGPTDNVDISGINTLFLDCSANDVTIGGFVGGVNGQILYIARLCAGAYSGILEHLEGGGSQDIYLHAGADENLDTEYGGWVLICNGTSWFDTSHAKHV